MKILLKRGHTKCLFLTFLNPGSSTNKNHLLKEYVDCKWPVSLQTKQTENNENVERLNMLDFVARL